MTDTQPTIIAEALANIVANGALVHQAAAKHGTPYSDRHASAAEHVIARGLASVYNKVAGLSDLPMVGDFTDSVRVKKSRPFWLVGSMRSATESRAITAALITSGSPRMATVLFVDTGEQYCADLMDEHTQAVLFRRNDVNAVWQSASPHAYVPPTSPVTDPFDAMRAVVGGAQEQFNFANVGVSAAHSAAIHVAVRAIGGGGVLLHNTKTPWAYCYTARSAHKPQFPVISGLR